MSSPASKTAAPDASIVVAGMVALVGVTGNLISTSLGFPSIATCLYMGFATYLILRTVKFNLVFATGKATPSAGGSDQLLHTKLNDLKTLVSDQSNVLTAINEVRTLVEEMKKTIDDGEEDSASDGYESEEELHPDAPRLSEDGEWEDEDASEDDEDDFEPLKMVLCVRQDLQMGKGKIGAQCGHATLGAYKRALRNCAEYVQRWEIIGQKKIAVKVNDEPEMMEIRRKANAAGLNTYVVADAGHTQVAAGSYTVLAIGPAPESRFEGVTDGLKLL